MTLAKCDIVYDLWWSQINSNLISSNNPAQKKKFITWNLNSFMSNLNFCTVYSSNKNKHKI